MTKIILPVSNETVREIIEQVCARSQGDRVVRLSDGRTGVDLGEIVLVAWAEKMIIEAVM